MPELLFEIGVEELPALAVEPAQDFIKSFMESSLKEHCLGYKSIQTYATPRRLVLIVDDLDKAQADIKEEVAGPSVAVAFDEHGVLTKAALGFLRARGIDEKDVFRKKTDKGEVIAALVEKIGVQTKDLLLKILPDMMRAIPFKKRMRWGASSDTFSRPVRWMVCLFDNDYLPVSYADVVADKQSYGHRYMAPEPFLVTSASQYCEEMKRRFVLLSARDREEGFYKDASEQLKPLDAHIVLDAELMTVVRNLLEYPFAIVGSFEDRYLAIPREILISELKTHQKCFALQNSKGDFLPNFLCSAATKPYDREFFAHGNARVVRARFEDGAFYFAEDKKQPLKKHAAALSSLVFERELGSMADKALRIEKNALALATIFSLSSQEKAHIKSASPLLKADLVTGVVGQFPELQGIMGRIYAGLDGEDAIVCSMIEQHYWPKFAEDDLPKTKASALLSVADKLDTIVGIISIGKRPVGNKDPFALRRAAIGIVRIIIHFGLNIDVRDLIKVAQDSFSKKLNDHGEEVRDFVLQRAYGLLLEDMVQENKSYATNLTEGVFATGDGNILSLFAKAHALMALRNHNEDEFMSLTAAIKRASNIVKKSDVSDTLSPHKVSLLTLPAEAKLVTLVHETNALMAKPAQDGQTIAAMTSYYRELCGHIARLKPKLDDFFANVMVMVDDKNLRDARLSLLGEIKIIADKVADFTHL